MLLGTEKQFLIYCTLSIHLCHFWTAWSNSMNGLVGKPLLYEISRYSFLSKNEVKLRKMKMNFSNFFSIRSMIYLVVSWSFKSIWLQKYSFRLHKEIITRGFNESIVWFMFTKARDFSKKGFWIFHCQN